ncbi:helix-turn-helix transcriptional regulator [Limibaculum sp. M0105]|uniref:Helix-turn-helix transcriptional regulator n=2 Tax=Thermohalobaculum xanthum TaxID=2753746 RepID=A0A8J7M4X0_9RHOB|nr:metalloregulator ArsR/SmtB family transcription factor [Thermohalobaculum xanthum]MBK0398343.1 helix-turn-helix transcriptional regulator [Thermohalobaculum xanthum]
MTPEEMAERVEEASTMLKAMSHSGRLMILCFLAEGEKSVTELEELLHWEQAAVSQQLARLRLQGLVANRREGKAIYYSLTDPRARQILDTLHEIFCAPK